jgi:hypothetical protein
MEVQNLNSHTRVSRLFNDAATLEVQNDLHVFILHCFLHLHFLFPETSVLTDTCRVPEMHANLPMPLTSALYDRYHISPSTNFVHIVDNLNIIF